MTNPKHDTASHPVRSGLEIAVIGMAGRFPGAKKLDIFWENLKNGVESISFFTDRELQEAGVGKQLLDKPGYVKSAGGMLEGKTDFDASFFGYTPREAEILNPQISVFYECAWEALENAAYNPFSGDSLIGLYAGALPDFYWNARTFLSGKHEIFGQLGTFLLAEGSYICTRVSYHLNLKGPSVAIYSACSTSLVAVHMACQALLNGECEIALAGGVSIQSNGGFGYLYQQGMILSPDGHCRAFDTRAKGTVSGEGVGAMVLKQLEYAIADGDFIHAVIKGTAVNNDGIGKVGYTAPGVSGQAEVIRTALRVAEVEPGSITYLETHGTGTPLGDPVEIEALTQAFNIKKKNFCAIGSVKTNIGHLDSAAGSAGLIKTVLALKHRLIPPNLHFEQANPGIDFENSPFYVNTTLEEWKNNNYPLRAGVSSFGIGGTNAHVVLEEWAGTHDSGQAQSREYQLIPFSAKTPSALEKIAENLCRCLKENPGINLADAAYTLQLGRQAFEYREFLVANTLDNAVETLSLPGPSRERTTPCTDEKKTLLVFMFPGLGAQYVNMGLDLYRTEPIFAEEIERCRDILKPLLGIDIKEILYPRHRSNRSYTSYKSHKSHIHQTEISHSVIFAFEYALARLMMAWGIKPRALIGYSLGEYAAACIAGVFSLPEALTLVVTRARLIRETPAGAMLSVPLTPGELIPLLPPGISLAIDNGESCIVGGSPAAIAGFERQMKERRYLTMRLQGSHAVHSHLMEPILKEFEKTVARCRGKKPQIPCISNVTGQWLTPEQAVNPGYWRQHLRQTVRFAAGIKELTKKPDTILVEVGPGRELTALVGRYIDKNGTGKPANPRAINLVKQSNNEIPDRCYLLNKIGQLWLQGIFIDWSNLHAGEKRSRVPLPTYPFASQRCWIEEETFIPGWQERVRGIPSQPERFYLPDWKRSPRTITLGSGQIRVKENWLVFLDSCGLGNALANRLRVHGHQVTLVTAGELFQQQRPDHYSIDPRQWEDYHRLFNALAAPGPVPNRILHFWSLTGAPVDSEETTVTHRFEKAQDQGLYSILYIARAISQLDSPLLFQLNVISDHLQDVTGLELIQAEKSPLLGLLKVIPQEKVNIRCRSIDVVLPAPGTQQQETLIRQLLEETVGNETISRPIAAFRGNHRWIQTVVPLHPAEVPPDRVPLRQGGVYLITGGLGGIGLVLAEYLVKTVKARLILTGRSSCPPRQQQRDKSGKWRKIADWAASGAEILTFSCDIADLERMKKIIHEAEQRFGPVHGVIHAAGLPGQSYFKLLRDTGKDQFREQFQAKVNGTLVLEELFRDKPVDFIWLMSSISTVLGGLRFAAYAAANAFMDVFVQERNRSSKVHWISVNWDALDPGDTGDAFAQILSLNNVNQVLVCREGNLRDRIHRWINLEPPREKPVSQSFPRPHLANPYVPPADKHQEILTGIWKTILGFEKIGVQDDFLELGGDSLKAITVISAVHKKLHVEIPLEEFFNRLTIEQLSRYLEQPEPGSSVYLPLTAVEAREYYPLSPAQKRLYFLQQMEKESTAYNVVQVVLVEGNLDRQRLENSFSRLIEAHESFRTSFALVGNTPVQQIHEPGNINFALKIVEAGTAAEGEEEPHLMVHALVRPYDLSRAPLLRVGLVKTGKQSNVLVIDMHHIITDGVSYAIFINQFSTLYRGGDIQGLPIHYKDYTQWLNGESQKNALRKQEDYWLTRFSGEIPRLTLPYDYPRPRVQSFAGDVVAFAFEGETRQALKKLASRENATLYMVLLSLFHILLGKLSDLEEIIIGTPVAGRRHPDLQPMVGTFINMLALRNPLVGDFTFIELLQRVKTSTLQAFANQEYPFEKLVEKAAVLRDPARNPLFDVVFVLQNVEQQPAGVDSYLEIPGLKLKPGEYQDQTSKFDLTLNADEIRDRLYFSFEYCTRLFRAETIERFINYLKRITAAVIENPGGKLMDIGIMAEEEKQQLLYGFNDTVALYPRSKTLHHLFAEQVEKAPDHIAAAGSPPVNYRTYMTYMSYISYRELNEKADRLAGLLIEKGVKPDTIAALMVEQSVETIIGILGILKAGGAYLPIDPDYPEERIQYMLTDSNAKFLVTTPGLSEKFEKLSFVNCQLLMVNEKPPYRRRLNNTPKEASSHPHLSPAPVTSLAYIIYTSGTTGQPRGVMVEHKNVVRLLFNDRFQFDFDETDVWTLFHSFCFDFSVWEMYGALLYSGCVIVVPRPVARDPRQFRQELQKDKVTVLNQTPSAFYNLIHEEMRHRGGQLNLRYVIFGGEALNPGKLNQWKERYPGTRLINMYGITETTVHVTYKEIREQEIAADISNIGQPIPTLSVYIMDRQQRLLPRGTAGELCVGGEGVTRGYLNQPELTAEKFNHDLWDYRDYLDKEKKRKNEPGREPIESLNQKFLTGGPGGAGVRRTHPIRGGIVSADVFHFFTCTCNLHLSPLAENASPGRRRHPTAWGPYKRIYKSGDLACLSPGMEIVYLGRIDQQVQVRGYRIEPGEIVNQLLKHEKIKDAVVIDITDEDSNVSLCAYFSAVHRLTPDLLRQYLATRLPNYMIPAYFIEVEKIPLTANGKPDRKALPYPGLTPGQAYVPPGNEIQKTLLKIWSKVLGRRAGQSSQLQDAIGIDDNFFNVGGDSIKVLGLVNAINDRLNCELKIVDIYIHGTIRQLAVRVGESSSHRLRDLFQQEAAAVEDLKHRILSQPEHKKTRESFNHIEDIYPMSDIERGLVFYYLKHAGTGIYHDQFIYPLVYRDFDIEGFQQALTLMIDKHDILRTGFNIDDFETPVHMVYKKGALPPDLSHIDLSGLSTGQQEETIMQLLDKDRRDPFDPVVPPMWRMRLFTLGKGRYCLLFIFHHAILDGWSVASLMMELHDTYLELRAHPSYVPPMLTANYKTTVIEEMVEKRSGQALAYWQSLLAGYRRLEFAATLKGKGELGLMDVFIYDAGEEMAAQVRHTASINRTSIKNLCFGAYAYVMSMFSYEKDVVVGFVTNIRTACQDGDKVLGCFLNTVPVRLRIPTLITWQQYMQWIEKNLQEVKAHERVSLFEIARVSGETSKDRNPFFDTLFNFMDFHVYQQDRPDHQSPRTFDSSKEMPRLQEQQDTNTLFDFEIDVTAGKFVLRPKYNSAAIDRQMVEKCCVYFLNILDKCIHHPSSLLRGDDVLTVEEKKQLILESNGEKAYYSKDKTIPQLLEERVVKTPDRAALVGTDGLNCLSYRQLNREANQLAGVLRENGLTRGNLAAVMMERSMDMAVAVIGVLKAGGAYVPLEPDLPERRLQKLLQALNTRYILTTMSTGEKVEVITRKLPREVYILSLQQGRVQRTGRKTAGNPPPAAVPGDMAYIIFTSGSTGTPKGVVETHRPVINVIEWVNRTFEISTRDKLLFITSLGFDLSVYDIFGILAAGGVIRVVGGKDLKEPERLLNIIAREGITFWDSAPAALQQLVPFFPGIKDKMVFNPLRLVFLSGDWIPLTMPGALRETFTGVQVISLGGATEATIWSNYFSIREVAPNWSSIPYGKPIHNARYYILDRWLNLCPIRVAGDLYIGGECLASGYINDVELTAEKFVEQVTGAGDRCRWKKENNKKFLRGGPGGAVFSKRVPPGRRRLKLYKTGDMARWWEDGNIEFLGRNDQQVKIRGYRIELGEVESQIVKHPAVIDSIVLAPLDAAGNKYLCAYFVAPEQIDKEQLKEHLLKELPGYMIPSYFIQIDNIPLTANGKVNLNALPEPGLALEDEYTAPGDKVEQSLVGIWGDILGLEKESISINSNFFEIGGHSLNATMLVSRIHKEFDVKIPLAEIFRTPTIKELSGYIRGASKDEYASIEPVEKKSYYPLSSAQKRLYFLQQLEEDGTGYNLPQVVSLEGDIEKNKLENIFKHLIAIHESLRTSFQMIEEQPVQKVLEPNEVEFLIQYKDLAAGDTLEENYKLQNTNKKETVDHHSSKNRIIHHFVRSFDLSRAPMLRVGLIRTAEKKYILMVDMHHIVTDATSQGMLIREFMALYSSTYTVKLSPPLRIQYKDYARWQNSEKEKKRIKVQEKYWKNEFKEQVPLLSLPTDYIRPAFQDFAGSSVGFSLGKVETRSLKELAAKENCTIYMVLLAVFNVLLSKLGGQEDIVVGTPTEGRTHAELEHIVGMFVNTLTMRNFPSKNKTFKQFLQEVKKRTLEAFENQEYQFEELVENVSVDRDTSRNPLFDVMFALQTPESPEVEIPGIELKPYEYDVTISKFDMTLTAFELPVKLSFNMEYCTTLFKKETIERFTFFYQKIASSILHYPDTKLSKIEVISKEEKEQILFDFNDTNVDFPKEKTIHQLFEEQVARTPNSIAAFGPSVEAIHESPLHLTYNQLNEKSNRLAYRLQEKGVQPDTIVGIMVERSIEMIIGILGILKAGGAYLPIDPEFPEKRKQYMLKDSDARTLVSELSELSELSEEIELVDLNKIEFNKDFPTHLTYLTHLTHPTHLSYVIYTSGSTGKPKGVAVEHIPVVNLLFALHNEYPFMESDTYLLKTEYIFDVSITELFAWFLSGGKCAILEKYGEIDTEKILNTIESVGITHVNFVPSMFNVFVEMLNPQNVSQLTSLKYIFLAGESLSTGLVKNFKRLTTKNVLENIYGPTEATVYASKYSLSQWKGIGPILIGKPLFNVKLYICDKARGLQAIGIPGELYIGGIGVARGYLNRPGLTAETFVEQLTGAGDRCSHGAPGRRKQKIYKTGDLARWLEDGNIEFLGRIDQQVKIRGYRIELGEIENQILNHKSIKEAVVLLREDKAESGNKYLCAYIVSTPPPEGNPPEVTGLKDYLSQKLPGYMLPSYFVQLEKIPLTPNGKIDRRALDSVGIQLNTGIEYVAPKSNKEKIIAQTWKDLLNRDRVGINDNFFDLGGNSFNIIQIIGKLRKLLDMDISMVTMFEFPTIRTFAQYLSRLSPAENPHDKDDKDTDTGITKKINRSRALKAAKKSKLKQQARRKRKN